MYYSVIDIETTGFSHRLYDKIIEIGIVKMDDYGNVIEMFETLINPNRDIGATHIHGITAEMLRKAPVFNEASNRLLNIIDETAIVAHNARFDVGFIESELELSGYKNLKWPYICTLELARKYLDELPSKKLEHICQYYDIAYNNKHSALSDTIATLKIFKNMMNEFGLKFSDENIFKNVERKENNDAEVKLVTRKNFYTSQVNYISPLKRLIDRLPEVKTNIVKEKLYLSLLDDILLDRVITEEELNVLTEIAIEHKISKNKMLELNKKYLKNLIRVYLCDDIISKSEKGDIDKVKKILMLENLNTDDLIEKVRNDHKAEIEPVKRNCAGKTVCFTGEFQSKKDGIPITREKAFEIAVSKGLIIKKSLVKKLDYLVLANVYSQSSKAKKARDYGVTLISENAFWSMLGIQVE